jgi:hypothetical protein
MKIMAGVMLLLALLVVVAWLAVSNATSTIPWWPTAAETPRVPLQKLGGP